MKSRYAKICPKCRSLDIRIRGQSFWFLGFPATFKCLNCGYTGSIFPEVRLTDDNVKKMVRKWQGKRRK